MSYEINYSDSINKEKIIVEDRSIDTTTSLQFPGTYRENYGQIIAENFLHLLENFANTSAPTNPIEGQLWYDTNETSSQLKLFDGTQWVSASGLKKSLVQPGTSSSSAGDLWVNLDSQQLYLYTGAAWVLVGPEYSSGLFTGVKIESLVGIDNITYDVFSLRVSNRTIAIYSLNSFTPKTRIEGFATIKPGINVSSSFKIYGTSEKAENLIVGNTVVPASSFLRSDEVSTTANQFRVLSDQGIVIGENSQTLIKVDNNSTIIQNSVSGSSLDIKMKNTTNTFPTTVMRIKSTGEVGIGSSDLEISEKLSVFGNIRIIPDSIETTTTGRLIVENTNESTDIDTGSIVTEGGVGIAQSINVGSNANISGTLTTGNVLPNANNIQIGTALNKFDKIYSNNFYGSLEGNVTGTVSGRAGSADKLTNPRSFNFTGDVDSSSVTFDGQNDVQFSIRLKNTLISDRTTSLNSDNLDEILINRKDPSGTEIGLFKITKQNFLKSIPTMPVGMITPYGGREAPVGWLLCDGSEIRKSDYPELWNVIRNLFKPVYELSDQGDQMFGLPDLRGRFPLGLTNMGGIDSERIQSNLANEVGYAGGKESAIINKNNLPDHEHNLTGNAGNQYYAVRAGADNPIDTDAISLSIDSGTGGTHGIPTSGNVLSDQLLNRPLDVLNPYLAVNYIIYTGR